MARYDIATTSDIEDNILQIINHLTREFIVHDKIFEFNFSNKHYYDIPQGEETSFVISTGVNIYKNLPCMLLRKKKSLRVNGVKEIELIGDCVFGRRIKTKPDTTTLIGRIYQNSILPHIQLTLPFIMNSIEYNMSIIKAQIEQGKDVGENNKIINFFEESCNKCIDKVKCALKNGKISRR